MVLTVKSKSKTGVEVVAARRCDLGVRRKFILAGIIVSFQPNSTSYDSSIICLKFKLGQLPECVNQVSIGERRLLCQRCRQRRGSMGNRHGKQSHDWQQGQSHLADSVEADTTDGQSDGQTVASFVQAADLPSPGNNMLSVPPDHCRSRT